MTRGVARESRLSKEALAAHTRSNAPAIAVSLSLSPPYAPLLLHPVSLFLCFFSTFTPSSLSLTRVFWFHGEGSQPTAAARLADSQSQEPCKCARKGSLAILSLVCRWKTEASGVLASSTAAAAVAAAAAVQALHTRYNFSGALCLPGISRLASRCRLFDS